MYYLETYLCKETSKGYKEENDSVDSLRKGIKIIFSGSLYVNPNK